MPIQRRDIDLEGNFAQIPNRFLRDRNLSYKARGVLAELMTHHENFNPSIEQMAAKGRDGISSVRSAIRELEEQGYLQRIVGNRRHGQFTEQTWVLSPGYRISARELSDSGLSTAKNTDLENTEVENISPEQMNTPLNHGFDKPWRATSTRHSQEYASTDAQKQMLYDNWVAEHGEAPDESRMDLWDAMSVEAAHRNIQEGRDAFFAHRSNGDLPTNIPGVSEEYMREAIEWNRG